VKTGLGAGFREVPAGTRVPNRFITRLCPPPVIYIFIIQPEACQSKIFPKKIADLLIMSIDKEKF
jgi:hypothetical protein